MNARFNLLLFVGAILLLASSQPVSAQVLWNSTTGDWAVGSNWVGGSAPTANQIAVITNGGAATIGLSATTVPSSGGYDQLWIGDGNTGPGGTFGPGNVNQLTGTTLNMVNWFELGRLYQYGGPLVSAANNISTYTLNGNAVLNNGGQAEIGWGWTNGNGLSNTTGILTLNDSSSFTQSNWMALGQADAGGVGILNINNNAVMTVATNGGNYVTLGNANGAAGAINVSGNGQFIEGGNNNLYLGGGGVSSSGALNMSGNAAVSAWDVRVGASGNGIFTQNGGVANVNGWLRIAEDTGSVGVYNLNAGTMNANLAFRCTEGGSGTLNVAAGAVLNVAQDMTMTATFDNEPAGNGLVNQNGGTVTVNGQVVVGEGGGGTAVYNMNGGLLAAKGGLVVATGGAIGTMYLNGGTLQTTSIGNNVASGTLYFNGGVLQATAGNTSFMASSGLNAYVQSGGAIINTGGNNIQFNTVISTDPALVGTDGGLIKQGAGTLGLTGNNSYNGPTTVNAGTLLITGNPTLTGNIEVKPGATLGTDTVLPAVQVDAGGTFAAGYTFSAVTQTGTAQPASLTTASGAVLTFKLSNSASAGNDQIDVAGNMSLANSTVINISQLLNSALSSGTYDLISAPSNTTPVGSLSLTGLPLTRQTHTLSSSPTQVDLVVSGSAANLVWAGSSSNNFWDLDTTKSWLNTGNGNQRDVFFTLDNVAFTDAGAGNGAVVLNGALQPGSVTLTMTNAASAYSFSGSGSITGQVGLVMNGVGSLTVNNSNSYTGETDIHGGNVVINSGGVLGDASGLNATYIGGPSVGDSASIAVHNGGTLSGTSLVLGYATGSTGALTQNGGVVNAVTGNLVVGNSGAGTITQSGGVANISNWFRLGEGTSGTGVANISGGTVNVGQRTFIGEMGGGTLNLSGNAVMSSGNVELGMPVDNTFLPGNGVLNVSGNAVLNVISEIGIGRGGGTGLVTIGGNASVTAGFTIDIGDSNNNSGSSQSNFGTSSGTLVQTGGTLTGASGAQMLVGQYDQPNVNSGVYNFSGGVANLSNWLVVGNSGGMGVMNISGSAVLNTSGEVHVGDGADVAQSSGTLNLSGNAVMTVNNWFVVGRNGGSGVMNMSGGLLIQQGNGNLLVGTDNNSQGILNQTGGTVDAVNQLLVPQDGNSSTLGTYNLSGSGVVVANSWIAVGRDGGAGNFNFSGGTITHANANGSHITIGSGGTGVFTMTGGLLVDSAPSAFIGEASNGQMIVSGGAASFNQIEMGVNGGITAELDLSGGSLSTTQIYLNNNTSTATLRLAGGTLEAAAGANSNFISGLTAAYVDSGTTTLNTNGGTITIGQSLLAGSGVGGLLVTGNGQLTLSGSNTYLGTTSVIEGRLIAANNEAIPDGGNISVGNDLSAFSAVIPAAAQSAGATAAVPEPGTLALAAAGAVVVIVVRRKRKKSKSWSSAL